MKNTQHWPLLSTLPAISTPFCNSRPNSTGEVDASCVSSWQRLPIVRLSVPTHGVLEPSCQGTAQHTFRMEAEQRNPFPWLRWGGFLCPCEWCVQNAEWIRFACLALRGEPAPWLLWDPLHGLQPARLWPYQCPEKRVQERRCTSGYRPKSRGKISSEKYFGFHSGNFIEGVSALYSAASLGDKWSVICLRVGAPYCLSFMAFGLCWTLMEHSKN